MSLDLTLAHMTLTQRSFDAVGRGGDPLHFRDRGVTYIDPITETDTGLQVRVVIANLFAVHGDPLLGLFLSASGGQAPHTAIHVDDFPVQTGPPDQRPDKLQIALENAFEFLYKDEIEVEDPDDDEFGQTINVQGFWPRIKIWNYPALLPRQDVDVGDYMLMAFAKDPPGNWWQRF